MKKPSQDKHISAANNDDLAYYTKAKKFTRFIQAGYIVFAALSLSVKLASIAGVVIILAAVIASLAR